MCALHDSIPPSPAQHAVAKRTAFQAGRLHFTVSKEGKRGCIQTHSVQESPRG